MIWAPGHTKLFVSHRDDDRTRARRIADALRDFGFSCFVAHEAIVAGSVWRRDLRAALETMDAMLVLVGDQDSSWVDQEVGFALARNVPIIPVCFQQRMPQGFLEDVQGFTMDLSRERPDVKSLVQEMTKGFSEGACIKDALIAAFLKSADFNVAIEKFNLLSSVVDAVSEEQADTLVRGFLANDQLYGSIFLVGSADRFLKFLNRTAPVQYRYEGGKIVTH